MAVTGYLSLYTTLLGWQAYDTLWSLMVGTGLAFLPFIAIVLRCFIEPYESQEPKSAAVITLRRLCIQIVTALLVVEFCAMPTVPLTAKVLHFEPPCNASYSSRADFSNSDNQNRAYATPNHTNTTYDNQFAVPVGVKVPPLWYLVMAISNGLNHAAITSLRCSPIDYRTLHTSLALSKIEDAALKKETVQFYNACYLPSYARYLSGDSDFRQAAQIKALLKKYGQQDIGWIGSYTFLQTAGFYDRYQAPVPITDFAFDSKRDQFDAQAITHPQYGRPTCAAWWSTPDKGLRSRLAQALPANFWQVVGHFLQGKQAIVDVGIQKLMTNSFQEASRADTLRGYASLNDYGKHFFSYAGSRIGLAVQQMGQYPTLYLIKNAVPVVQALLLMAVYALLGLVLPFSGYRISFLATAISVIMALTLWSFLSHWVSNIDNRLLAALYRTPLELSGADPLDETFVDLIIGGLYIGLPLLLLLMFSWAGIHIGHAMAGLFDSASGIAKQAGGHAGSAATSALRVAGKSLIKK